MSDDKIIQYRMSDDKIRVTILIPKNVLELIEKENKVNGELSTRSGYLNQILRNHLGLPSIFNIKFEFKNLYRIKTQTVKQSNEKQNPKS